MWRAAAWPGSGAFPSRHHHWLGIMNHPPPEAALLLLVWLGLPLPATKAPACLVATVRH